MRRIIFQLALLLGVMACGDETTTIADKQPYEGPLRTARDVEMKYSETAKKKSYLKTPLMLEFKSGDREFPEGLYLEFFNEKGEISSVLKANYARYSKAENVWKSTGDVEVKSLLKDQQLNTEELFWNPEEELIYTEKFVTIKQKGQVLYGTGLESDQDFTNFTIKKTAGEIELQ